MEEHVFQKLQHTVWAALLLSAVAFCQNEGASKPESLYITVGNLVLEAEDHIVKPVLNNQGEKKEEKSNEEKVNEMIKPLSSNHKKEIVFNLLARQGQLQTTSVIEPYVLHELNIICGSEHSKKLNLFSQVNKTQTTFGSAVLARMIAELQVDKVLLAQRQGMVRTLIDNKNVADSLNNAFKLIGEHESNLLHLWGPSAQLDPMFALRVYFPKGWFDRFNKRADILQALRSINLVTIGAITLYVIGSMAFMHVLPFVAKERRIIHTLETRFDGSTRDIYTERYVNVFSPMTASLISLGAGGLVDILGFFSLKKIYDEIKLTNYLTYILHTRMRSVKEIIDALNTIYEVVSPHKNLIVGIKAFNKLETFIKNPYLLSENLDKLISLLQEPVFEVKPVWSSHLGQVLAAHILLYEVKDHFIEVLEAAGELEAYLSIAHVMKEHKGKRVEYSFVEFVDNKVPYIELVNVWNPLLDSKLVVTETITFGKPEHAHNIMLTGPHGGGKSTFMRSVAYSIILSQTFGIAPAHKARMTIFNKLNSYANIKEDLTIGDSTFMAEKKRVNEILGRLKALKPGELGFTVMDEVFKGTMEAEGSVRLHTFGKAIASIPESMCIIATHFEKSAHLEEETNGEFTNYHVGLIEQEDHTFHRTFKLVKGKNEWWFGDPAKRERYIEWLTSVI